MPESIEQLEARRALLAKQLIQISDMRQGSLSEYYGRCGKESCCCHDSKHPGHGPYYAFTKKVEGKTKTLQLRQGPRLSKIEREVEAYKEFRKTCDELVKVSEKICDLRPLEEKAGKDSLTVLKKKLFRRSRRRSPGKPNA